ncbi:MAG: hypothetical protein COA63_009775 [Methylophaga sp.]|nr:hypothetical protein [Methylophaga sp.]
MKGDKSSGASGGHRQYFVSLRVGQNKPKLPIAKSQHYIHNNNDVCRLVVLLSFD